MDPPPATDPAPRRADQPAPPTQPSPSALFAGVLDEFAKIVGPEAARTTFHYASVQEGRRIADVHGRDTVGALAAVDAVIGSRSRILADELSIVRIGIVNSTFLRAADQVRLGIMSGLLEGVLHATRGVPHHATWLPTEPGQERVLELRRTDMD